MQSALPATIEPKAPPTDAKPVKKPRVPARIVQLVELLVTGEASSIKAACEQLKLDRSYVSKQMRKVHVADHLAQQTRVTLARLQAPAAAKLGTLLAGAQSEHVQKDVAIHLLSIAGHKPAANTQVSVSVDVRAGYVLDLREPGERGSGAQLTHAHTVIVDNGEKSA